MTDEMKALVERLRHVLMLYNDGHIEAAKQIIAAAIAALSRPLPGVVEGCEPSECIKVTILYKNWRGVIELREITPIGGSMRFGFNEWHRTPQWLFSAVDEDTHEIREFSWSSVLAWGRA